VCTHVEWLHKKFEPMRSDSSTTCATAQHNVAKIGSKIPSKHRANPDQLRLTGNNSSSSGDERSSLHASATPAALASVASAVHPAGSRQKNFSSPQFAHAPSATRTHSLALVLAILASAVAVVVLERKLARGAMRQSLRPGGQVQALSGMPVPSVRDFLSQLSQWAAAGAQISSTAGMAAGLASTSPLALALRNTGSIFRQLTNLFG
jgi:hypothetical protein